jgi:CheY-like chemotaxis protein
MSQPRTVKVLLTDDDDMVREMLADAMSTAGLDVIEARNGIECLEKLRANAVDVIVIDIIMPEKEGIETIMDIRAEYPHQKIIAISGGGRTRNDDFLTLAQKIGANATFRKPFDPALIVSQIWNMGAEHGRVSP